MNPCTLTPFTDPIHLGTHKLREDEQEQEWFEVFHFFAERSSAGTGSEWNEKDHVIEKLIAGCSSRALFGS